MGTQIHRTPDARAVAVIAHPHPDFGGNMHNPVVTALHAGLAAAGCSTLRFDFNGSAQPHADLAEAEQLAAEAFGDLDVVRAGYSFGADTILTAPRASKLIGEVLVAPPLAVFGDRPVTTPDVARLVIVGTHDQFRSPDSLRACIGDWAHTEVVEAPTADHFMAGSMDLVEDHTSRAVTTWLDARLS